MDSVVSTFGSAVKSASDFITLAFDAPSTRAVVFGVPIGGVPSIATLKDSNFFID